MGNESEKVIITYLANYDFHLNNLRKYNQFINRVYSNTKQILSYLETIEHGLVIIYNDFNTFKLLVSPITEEIRKKSNDLATKEKNFLLEGLENGDTFPKEGYIIIAESTSNPIEQLFPYIKKFYESMHPDIIVKMNEKTKIEIRMKTFDSFVMYNNILFGITRMFE